MPRDAVDFTMMSTFCLCRRKYHYRMERGLVLPTPATAPSFGGAIHKGLDRLYTSKMEDVTGAVEIFKNGFVEQLDVDDKRTHVLGEWILKNYQEVYKEQPLTALVVEKEFELLMPGTQRKFIGRIDKIVDWDGTLWIMDHKTTSQLGATYGKSVEPNAQYTGYVWAAREMGYNVVGVIVDAILVAKGLLQAASRARLTPLARFDAYRSQKQLEEWVKEREGILKDLTYSEENGHWPMDGTFNGMCTYYGECGYRRLCIEEAGLRDRVIGMDYKVDHWDPRSKKEIGGD